MVATKSSFKTSKSSTPDDREICWGDLTILTFDNILGDNPGVSEGAPLTIGWKHKTRNVVGVDYYEYLRQSRPRRKRKELIMSSGARDAYLLGLGYQLDQLVEASEETKRIRKSRQANMKGKWESFRKILEIAGPKRTNPRSVLSKAA